MKVSHFSDQDDVQIETFPFKGKQLKVTGTSIRWLFQGFIKGDERRTRTPSGTSATRRSSVGAASGGSWPSSTRTSARSAGGAAASRSDSGAGACGAFRYPGTDMVGMGGWRAILRTMAERCW